MSVPASSFTQQTSEYQPHLDGLRAIAILAVVGYHFFPSWVPGGFVGVDVFFVLSGFLITGHLLRDFSSGVFSLGRFYRRRIRRLLPALVLVMSCSALFGWYALLADEYELLGKHLLSSASFVQNLVLWTESGYFDQVAVHKPLLHLWSLGVEEQFYLVWPLLISLGWWLGSSCVGRGLHGQFGVLMVGIGLLLMLSFSHGLVQLSGDPTGAYYSPLSRLWELAAGSVLATFLRVNSGSLMSIPPFLHGLLSFGGLLLLLLSFFLINDQRAFPGWWALVPVLGALLLVLSGGVTPIVRTILCHPVAVWFGLISYPLYLWHWPLLSFPHIIFGERPGIPSRITILLCSIVFAWITWRWVEHPFRFGAMKHRAVSVLLAGMVAIGAFGGYLWASQGVIDRSSVRALSLMTLDLRSEREPDQSLWCADAPDNSFCYFSGKGNQQASAALIGDSHAAALYPGLAVSLEDRDESLLMVGSAGCPPLIEVASSDTSALDERQCLDRMTPALERVLETDSIQQVFLTGRGPMYTTGDGFGGYRDSYGDWTLRLSDEANGKRSNPEVYEIGLRRTLDALLKQDKQVIFLHDVPELGFDVRSCLPDRPFAPEGQQRWPCGVDRRVFEQRYQSFKTLIDKVMSDYPSVQVISMAEALCDDVFCLGAEEGILLYQDDDHLSRRGAVRVSKYLMMKLDGLSSE